MVHHVERGKWRNWARYFLAASERLFFGTPSSPANLTITMQIWKNVFTGNKEAYFCITIGSSTNRIANWKQETEFVNLNKLRILMVWSWYNWLVNKRLCPRFKLCVTCCDDDQCLTPWFASVGWSHNACFAIARIINAPINLQHLSDVTKHSIAQ